MRYYYDYSFPIGNLTIEEDGHGICGIYFGTKTLEGEKKNTELIREAALQLSQYFDGRRKKFDLKLSYQIVRSYTESERHHDDLVTPLQMLFQQPDSCGEIHCMTGRN